MAIATSKAVSLPRLDCGCRYWPVASRVWGSGTMSRRMAVQAVESQSWRLIFSVSSGTPMHKLQETVFGEVVCVSIPRSTQASPVPILRYSLCCLNPWFGNG